MIVPTQVLLSAPVPANTDADATAAGKKGGLIRGTAKVATAPVRGAVRAVSNRIGSGSESETDTHLHSTSQSDSS